MVTVLGICSCLYPVTNCHLDHWALGWGGILHLENHWIFGWRKANLCSEGGRFLWLAYCCDNLVGWSVCFFFQGGYFDRRPNYSGEPACEGTPGCNSSQCSSTGRLLRLPWCSSWICAWPVWWQRVWEHVWVGKEIPTEQNRGKETLFILRSHMFRVIKSC